MNTPYQSVACGFYDHLEATAVRRQVVKVVFVDADGCHHAVEAGIADVFSRDRAEFLRLTTGEEIRLDRLVQVGDVPVAGQQC